MGETSVYIGDLVSIHLLHDRLEHTQLLMKFKNSLYRFPLSNNNSWLDNVVRVALELEHNKPQFSHIIHKMYVQQTKSGRTQEKKL